jgi:hypothetical protein
MLFHIDGCGRVGVFHKGNTTDTSLSEFDCSLELDKIEIAHMIFA